MMIGDNQLISACSYGKFYFPAIKHYEYKGLVYCDLCKKTNIPACIGYKNIDLCMLCAYTVNSCTKYDELDICKTLMEQYMFYSNFSRPKILQSNNEIKLLDPPKNNILCQSNFFNKDIDKININKLVNSIQNGNYYCHDIFCKYKCYACGNTMRAGVGDQFNMLCLHCIDDALNINFVWNCIYA